MAIYTKSEFAKECGMTTNSLKQYIKRIKVSVNFENKIDTSEAINAAFLESRKKFVEEKNKRPLPHVEKDDDVQYKREKKTSEDEVIGHGEEIEGELALFTEEELKAMPAWMLEKIQRIVYIQKGAEERDLLKIKKDKIHGTVIPTDMVKNLFSQHNKSVLVEFSNSIDVILTKLSKKLKLNNTQQTEIRKEMICELNLAVSKSIDQTKDDLKTVIKLSTEARGKGEKK